MRRTFAAAALLALLMAAPARADGDPASDILYGDNVFLSLVSPQVNAKGKVLEELTDQGRTALLAQPGKADDLARQIVGLLRDPNLGRQIMDAQRQAMAERFDPEQLLDRYISVYRRVVDHTT